VKAEAVNLQGAGISPKLWPEKVSGRKGWLTGLNQSRQEGTDQATRRAQKLSTTRRLRAASLAKTRLGLPRSGDSVKGLEDTVEFRLRQSSALFGGRADNLDVVAVQVKDFQVDAPRFSRVADLKSALVRQLKRKHACFETRGKGDGLDRQQRYATHRLRARSERSDGRRRGVQQGRILIVR
jgi:hypothetical protein